MTNSVPFFGNFLTLRGLPHYGVLKVIGYDYINDRPGLSTTLESSISFRSVGVLDGSIGQWIMGTNMSNIPIGFFGIKNASNNTTPFVIDPNTSFVGMNTVSPDKQLTVSGDVHVTDIHYVDNHIEVNSTSGGESVINPVAGSGLVLKGAGLSGYGQLRIISKSGAWADHLETAYFQIQNDGVTNNATFMGGSFVTDAPLNRLQFNSNNTTITDKSFTNTPIPDSLLELIPSVDKKLLKLVGVVGQISDYINVENSLSSMLLQLDNLGNLNIFGLIKSGGFSIARFVLTKPTSSTDLGTKGDYFIDTSGAYFCIDTNSWLKIAAITTF